MKLIDTNIPQFVFYTCDNPEYLKEWELSDFYKPSKKDWERIESDYVTLGKRIPPYEEWAVQSQQAQLITHIAISRCNRTAMKLVVLNDDDLKEQLKSLVNDKSITFIKENIQQYFETIKERM